ANRNIKATTVIAEIGKAIVNAGDDADMKPVAAGAAGKASSSSKFDSKKMLAAKKGKAAAPAS
ncbi:hypothetical protein OY671_008102, partial [Metschnikowia pulcherrima]